MWVFEYQYYWIKCSAYLTEQESYWGTEFVDTYIPLLQKVKYKILSYDYFYVF